MTGKKLPYSGKSTYKHKLLTEYPDGMVIVIDTRESDPLFFRGEKPRKDVPIVRKTLPYGDYSLLGFEGCISFERKKPTDLYSCLGKERDRFKRELEKLKDFERKYILVEAPESEVLACIEYTKLHPNVVRQSLASIEMKLGIPIHYAQNKTASELWMMDRFVKYFRWKREG